MCSEMCLLTGFFENLHEYLTGNRCITGNIIRKHTKKLEVLGDISFPLNVRNWSQTPKPLGFEHTQESTIFDYLHPDQALDTQIQLLLEKSQTWCLSVVKYELKKKCDLHLYLNRPKVIDLCIREVLKQGNWYGFYEKCFQDKIIVTLNPNIGLDIERMSLTELRASIVQNVSANVTSALISDQAQATSKIAVVLYCKTKTDCNVMCGPVLTETGIKDVKTAAAELYKKRSLDMQLMAQHKYGLQMKPSWSDYFEKLGKASVVLEMLQNKCHKPIKVTLNNLQTANKGPSFIFYNCARLSTLLKEFDKRVSNKTYPALPAIDAIDFSLLDQPEEWEMVYVHILQFPSMINSCVCDIKFGVVNLHDLVLFLSNLSSVFSIYYRRVKILTSEKEHLLPVLYARIYLVKAVLQVFHTVLCLLNIEPIKEM